MGDWKKMDDYREVRMLGSRFKRAIPDKKFIKSSILAVTFQEQLKGFIALAKRVEGGSYRAWKVLSLSGLVLGESSTQVGAIQLALRMRW